MLKAIILGSAIGVSAGSGGDHPSPENFAFTMAMQTPVEAPAYVLAMPHAVYESATRADLGDLRVFNRAGNVVPHVIRTPQDSVSSFSHDWLTIEALALADDGTVYEFDSGGWFPVDTIIIEFAERNTLAHVNVLSRSSPAEAWRRRFAGPAYEIYADHLTLSSEPIVVPVRSERYWRLEVDRASGGIGRRKPGLRIAWRPHELFFVAEGAPPFLLAFGSTQTRPLPTPVADMIRDLERDTLTGLTVRARTNGEVHHGNRRNLLREGSSSWWRRSTLWGVLISTVLGLVLLSLSFYLRHHG